MLQFALALPTRAAPTAGGRAGPPSTSPHGVLARRRGGGVPPSHTPDGLPRCGFDASPACRGAIATIACADCAAYDAVHGRGLYCGPCFDARHPWVRQPHRAVRLELPPPPPPPPQPDPLPPPVRGVADLLADARAAAAALDPPLQPRLAAMGAAAAGLRGTLARLAAGVAALRDDAARERAAAARKIQGLYRRRRARALMLTAARLLWGRVLDPPSGRYFFVHRYTGATQWDPPVVFGRALEVGLFPKVLAGALSEDAAAGMIQAAWRGRAARAGMAALLRGCFRRCVDPSSQREYFVNLLTGAARWERSALLRGVDLPVFTAADARGDPAVRARAAAAVQAAWRAHAARAVLAARAAERWEAVRIRAPAGGRGGHRTYYHDTASGATQWRRPLARALRWWRPPLRAGGADAGAAPLTREQAAGILQWFARGVRVRLRVQPLAAALYGVGEGGGGVVFFVHLPSGRASWKRPALLLPGTRLQRATAAGQ